MQKSEVIKGMWVTYFPIIKADGTKLNEFNTRITSDVIETNDGISVVMIEGRRGYVQISHLESVEPPESKNLLELNKMNKTPNFGEWVQVADNIQPKDKTAVIVATKSNSVMEMYFVEKEFMYLDSNGGYTLKTKEVTHWMPMPDLPNQ